MVAGNIHVVECYLPQRHDGCSLGQLVCTGFLSWAMCTFRRKCVHHMQGMHALPDAEHAPLSQHFCDTGAIAILSLFVRPDVEYIIVPRNTSIHDSIVSAVVHIGTTHPANARCAWYKPCLTRLACFSASWQQRVPISKHKTSRHQ